jgi:hypothetical protein
MCGIVGVQVNCQKNLYEGRLIFEKLGFNCVYCPFSAEGIDAVGELRPAAMDQKVMYFGVENV